MELEGLHIQRATCKLYKDFHQRRGLVSLTRCCSRVNCMYVCMYILQYMIYI